MATIRKRVTSTTADALQTEKFANLGAGPHVINLWAAGVTNSDDIGLLLGNTEIVSQGTDINVEVAADVIDTDRDQLVFSEVVMGPGKLYMPITVTTEMQFLLSVKPLG